MQKNSFIFISSLFVLFLLILIGAGCGKKDENQKSQTVTESPTVTQEKNTEDDLVSQPASTQSTVTLDTKNQDSTLCTEEPTMNELGEALYPVDPQYGELKYLGELFTADDCGIDRVSQLYGFYKGDYILGSQLELSQNPSAELLSTLEEIGFTCEELAGDAETCVSWGLRESVPVETMLQLKPYHEEFFSNDCMLCG